MNRLLIAAIFALVSPVAAADAASARDMARCQAMSSTFGPKQKQVAELKEARDAQAEVVETYGEAWDDFEILRNVSAVNAANADAAKADYEAAKAELIRLEQGLQAAVADLNTDISAYNQSCAPEE